jgi:hypothetical protein
MLTLMIDELNLETWLKVQARKVNAPGIIERQWPAKVDNLVYDSAR